MIVVAADREDRPIKKVPAAVSKVLPILVGALLTTGAIADGDAIVLRCDFAPPSLEADGRYFDVTMMDLPPARTAGLPVLPYKPLRVLVPDGREVQSVSIVPGEKITLEGSYRVRPAEQPVPLSYQGPPVATEPDEAVYGSLSPFPPDPLTDVSIQEKRPYRVVLLNIHPVSYVPARGEISYYRSIVLTVSLKPTAKTAAVDQSSPPNPRDEDSIRRMVENPEALQTYTDSSARKSGGIGLYPHVIITSQELADASGAYTFQDLADHRTSRGTPSTIVTTEYIYANFDGTRPDGGSDNQTRIRNFIGWARENWSAEYVLLAGFSGIIPARYLNADGTNIPSDMYYGNLDGTFDNDADGTYGEPNDGAGGGEIDLYAEVYVGRAGVEDEAGVSNFVGKTISYETGPSEYLRRAYMVGEYLGFGGDSEYAKPSMEEIRLGSCAHGYCTKGFSEDGFFQTSTLYDADGTWSKNQLVSAVNSGVHVLNHLGHAGYTYDMKLTTSDLSSFTNTDYFFTYSQGCQPGGFDTADCFAEEITTMEHGAFAAVMNARYGWGAYNSTAGPSQYYDREFWDALFGEGIKELGRMNADSKEDNDSRINGGRMRWCFYELNLFGDPATEIRNTSSKGIVSFDGGAYPIPGTASVTVMDLDLDADTGAPDSVAVTLTSAPTGDAESLLLTETGASTKTFRGSIPIAEGSPVHGDGTVQVSDGDTLTVTYNDADDGMGNPAAVQDTAAADGSGPVISNVSCTPSVTSCAITWETSEPSDSTVRYGDAAPPSLESTHPAASSSHSIRIRGLVPLTTYYFDVISADAVGNTTMDDNGGSYYQFTTLERGAILFVDDDEGGALESYFTAALESNSYSYDTWEVSQEGSPSFEDLDDYQIVIWNCGAEWRNPTSGLTESDENALSSYVDGGGSLFLCGQDILYNGVSDAFHDDYLHLAAGDSDDATAAANGIDGDRISGGMSLALNYPFSNYSDSLDPDSSSSGVFLADGSTTYPYCATRYPAAGTAGPFKIVFFAFPFESISSSDNAPDNAATVIDRVMQFLAPIDVEGVSASYGLNDRPMDISIYGSNFSEGFSVTIGAVPLTSTASTGTSISANIPAGLPPGTHDLLVTNPDSLRDGIPSAYTALDPAGDFDGDGLSNEAEIVTHGTHPLLADSDGDLLVDGAEIGYGTNPLDPDQDGDGLSDYEEVNYNSGDGCYDPYDAIANPAGTDTDANRADTDGDGCSDFLESASGSSPIDRLDVPNSIFINFQPDGASSTGNHVSDCGAAFNARGYGWRP